MDANGGSDPIRNGSPPLDKWWGVPKRGGVRCPEACPALPPLMAHQRQKGGVAPTTSTPPVRRAAAARGRGTREAQPRFAFPQWTREIRVVPRPVRRFGEAFDHNGENSAL